MATATHRGAGARSATPILSSDAAKRIREKTGKAWERDVNNLVRERSAYRYAWPFLLVLATLLNIDLAVSYMIRTADVPPDAPSVLFGLAWVELKSAAIAVVLIVSSRVLMVLLSDDETTGKGASAGRAATWVVMVALIFFSIWTAQAETTTKLQTTIDKSAASSVASTTAAANATTAGDILSDAKLSRTRALVDLENAQGRATTTRAALERHIADAKVRYASDGASYGWAINARDGLAKPYADAIRAADAAIVTAQARVTAAEATINAASAAVIVAGRERARAANDTGSEGTAIASMGKLFPWWLGGPYTPSELAVAQGLFLAILLEVVCFAGSGATSRLLKGALNSHSEALGDTADVIRDRARDTLTASPMPVQQAQAQAGPVDTGRRRFAGWGRVGARSDMATSSGLDTGPGPDAVDLAKAQADAVSKMVHADAVAAVVADARTGNLASASIPHLRDDLGHTNAVAYQIRDALIAEGLAVQMPGNRVTLLGA